MISYEKYERLWRLKPFRLFQVQFLECPPWACCCCTATYIQSRRLYIAASSTSSYFLSRHSAVIISRVVLRTRGHLVNLRILNGAPGERTNLESFKNLTQKSGSINFAFGFSRGVKSVFFLPSFLPPYSTLSSPHTFIIPHPLFALSLKREGKRGQVDGGGMLVGRSI